MGNIGHWQYIHFCETSDPMVSWCSWLSRVLHMAEVSSSILGEIIFSTTTITILKPIRDGLSLAFKIGLKMLKSQFSGNCLGL